jgi:hypothetical protein
MSRKPGAQKEKPCGGNRTANHRSSRMTLEAALSTAAAILATLVMLTTHKSAVYVLAAAIVANESAKEAGR